MVERRTWAGRVLRCTLLLAGTMGSATTAAGQERATLPILDAVTLTASCEYMLDDARARAAEIEAIPLEQATVATVLERWDANVLAQEDIVGPVSILQNVHPDPGVRTAAEGCIQKLSTFSTELYQNEKLYQRISAVAPDDEISAKLRDDLLQSFEDTGVNLPAEKRSRAREISQRLTELQQEFERNLRDDSTTLVFTPAEYEGVPQSYIEAAKKDAAGNIIVTTDAPDYTPFMRNSRNAEARRRFYLAYLNVGAPRNIEILDEMSALRRELASLHGQPSYASYIIRRRMAGSPTAVAGFLAEVESAVTDAQRAEIEELRQLKARLTGEPAGSARLNPWDLGFYRERLRQERYAVNQEELRSYFPTEPTLDWVLDMSGRLYDVTFTEAQVPEWHPDVRYFDVTDNVTKEHLGGLYVAVYPRPGKYQHAAVWPVRSSSSLADRRPVSVLVTNLDRRGLTHAELETLLHELGHALHGIFSQTRYGTHSGTSVERDFVEAPSQMYEEWIRRAETLATIRESCPDCPLLSQDQIDRLNAARLLGQGMAYAGQRLYAAYDQALTGPTPVSVLDEWHRLEAETPLGTTQGTYFPAQFTHLANHYGAGYYGYMWSQVIALDMLSAFGQNLMDPAVGRRFREIVLARGGERPAMEAVEEFLGREVSSEAFFEEIRGQR